jgi:RNA polymerase sigma-70 factor (ECF subfamily)
LEEPDPLAIRRAAAGDTAAFESLVRAYQVPVWRFLRHFLSDASLAEDVAQETFVRLYTRLDTFSFQSKFSTWVFQIARNCGIDEVRRQQRTERLVASLPRPAPPADPELHAQLDAAIAALRPAAREALLTVEILGLTYAEAASVIGVPAGTVKSRVFAAREQLARWRRSGENADEM